MTKIFMGILLCLVISSAKADEWVPYVYRPPVVVLQNFQAISVPVPVFYPYFVPVVAVAPQYVPVTTYHSVLVERRYCCFLKRYEVVSIPQTQYVPIRY